MAQRTDDAQRSGIDAGPAGPTRDNLLDRIVQMRSWLRHQGLYHAISARNRARRIEWDLITGPSVEARVRSQCLEWDEENELNGVARTTGDPRIDAAIERAKTETHPSYVCRYVGRCVIEPRYGYVVDSPLRLIDLSMPFSEWSRNARYRHLIGMPSPARVGAARLAGSRVVHRDRVITLRFLWEDNYFHFLNDVLPRLALVSEHGIPRDVPVVVGVRLARQGYFRAAFPDGTMDGREIIVQDKEYIAADEVIFARAEAGRRSLSVTADLLGAPAHPQGNRRMFITRAPHRGRTIANFEELRPVLERHGFEIVDTDGMSLQDQIALFASTAVLAGIHGAGLANMVYRRNAPCTVLEIFPPTEESTWFAAMAGHLGFAYHALSGEAMGRIFDRNAPFDVDPARLEAWLKCITATSR